MGCEIEQCLVYLGINFGKQTLKGLNMIDKLKLLLIKIMVITGFRLPHSDKTFEINREANKEFRLNYVSHRRYYDGD